jgi:hypothetical protein
MTDRLNLRKFIRASLISLNEVRFSDVYDTGVELDAFPDDQKLIDEFKGTTPDINTTWGDAYQKAAQITGVDYYVVINGKIDKGDASFATVPNAVTICNNFITAVKTVVKELTPIPIGYGALPNIDTDDIGDDDVDGLLRQFAIAIEKSNVPKIKTLFAKALQVAKNDRVRAAAICYESVKRLPVVIGVALFTRPGRKTNIKGTAIQRFRTRQPPEGGESSYMQESPPENSAIAFCASGNYPTGYIYDNPLRDIDQPVIFLNADDLERTTAAAIEHEVGHALDSIFNSACKKYDSVKSSTKSETDYIGEADMPVIALLAPPPIPSTGPMSTEDGTSSPNAMSYLKSAMDFLKSVPGLLSYSATPVPVKNPRTPAEKQVKTVYDKHMSAREAQAITTARFSFQILSTLTGRDYSGVGSVFSASTKYGVNNSVISDSWYKLEGEQRNAVKSIYRIHNNLRADKEYMSAPDARLMIAIAAQTAVKGSAEPDLIAFILAAIGPHPASDFDKWAGVAAADIPKGDERSVATERWMRLAGLV